MVLISSLAIYTIGLQMAIRDEILEEILKEYKNPEDLAQENLERFARIFGID